MKIAHDVRTPHRFIFFFFRLFNSDGKKKKAAPHFNIDSL
jgi:hypothetical protein